MLDTTTEFGVRATRRLRKKQIIWLTTVASHFIYSGEQIRCAYTWSSNAIKTR